MPTPTTTRTRLELSTIRTRITSHRALLAVEPNRVARLELERTIAYWEGALAGLY